MDLFGKKDKENTQTIKELQREILRLKDSLEEAQRVVADVKAEISNCDFSFDFANINAFSIERNFDNNLPVTVIGYLTNDKNETKEWYLYCSTEQHQKLVEQFNRIKKIK